MIQNQVGGGSGIEYTVKEFVGRGSNTYKLTGFPEDAKNYVVYALDELQSSGITRMLSFIDGVGRLVSGRSSTEFESRLADGTFTTISGMYNGFKYRIIVW